jgi:hypothetical protein
MDQLYAAASQLGMMRMQNTRTGTSAGRPFAPSVEDGAEIYEDLNISLEDIPERPGVTTILKRPGGRIIRHAATAGESGAIGGVPGSNPASDALTTATQTVRKTVTEHPLASMAVLFAVGYLIGRKRR